VIMSPVTHKSAEGLPVFYLGDIPPVATGGPPVREPRIYYGELTDTYVLVKGSTSEFDYPKGKDNVYTPYGGTGGVPVGSLARRALFAWYFNDPNILISSYLAGESRIMFRRTIKERVAAIAPFLRLDRNPYLVISNGRLFWMQDAYTTSNYFPYAVAYGGDGGLNYIRNSVKVVVDAYTGSVDLYLADSADPIAATYQHISLLCSRPSRPCHRTCRGIFAILRISSSSRRTHTQHITWKLRTCFIIGRISGSFLASPWRPASPRTAALPR